MSFPSVPWILLHVSYIIECWFFLHLQLSEEKRDQFESWEGERASSTSTIITDLSLVSPSSASESYPLLSLPADLQLSMSHLPTSSVPITTPGPVHTHPLPPPPTPLTGEPSTHWTPPPPTADVQECVNPQPQPPRSKKPRTMKDFFQMEPQD